MGCRWLKWLNLYVKSRWEVTFGEFGGGCNSFVYIQIRKGDGLPQHICSDCLNSVSSLQKLRTTSLRSNRLLYDVVNSHRSYGINESEDLPIEFIDTQSNVKKELLAESEIKTNCSVDELSLLECSFNTELNDTNVKKSRRKRKEMGEKTRKVSCEMCGKLVPIHFIEFHLNLHKGLSIISLSNSK